MIRGLLLMGLASACLALPGAGLAASGTALELNEELAPAEQYRRLSLILLIGEGVNETLLGGLHAFAGPVGPGQSVDPDELKSPLIRIVDQKTMLSGTVYLFRLAIEHGAAIAQRRQALARAHAGEIAGVSIDAVREDSILVRNAIADSIEYAGLAAEPELAPAVQAYRERTLQLRNLMEFTQFDRELDRITEEAIASVGGKLDAYQRMFDDEVQSDTFDRHIRAAEYRYTGRSAFDEDAGKLAEQIMEGVILSESQPEP